MLALDEKFRVSEFLEIHFRTDDIESRIEALELLREVHRGNRKYFLDLFFGFEAIYELLRRLLTEDEHINREINNINALITQSHLVKDTRQDFREKHMARICQRVNIIVGLVMIALSE